MNNLIYIVKCGVYEAEHIGYITQSPSKVIEYVKRYRPCSSTPNFEDATFVEVWELESDNPIKEFSVLSPRWYITQEEAFISFLKNFKEYLSNEH